MKALSIQQPWLHAILHEGKDIENRPRQSHSRGWIALHASLKVQRRPYSTRCIQNVDVDSLDTGVICGVARLTDVVTKSRSKWFQQPGRGDVNYGWVLEEVKVLKTPIPCKGMLGLWAVPPRTQILIEKQIPKLDLRS